MEHKISQRILKEDNVSALVSGNHTISSDTFATQCAISIQALF